MLIDRHKNYLFVQDPAVRLTLKLAKTGRMTKKDRKEIERIAEENTFQGVLAGSERQKTLRLLALEYLSNPANTSLTRIALAKHLKFSNVGNMYRDIPSDEVAAVYSEALGMRRKAYAEFLMKVDAALLKKACTGNAAEAKLVYQRFEDWTEKTKSEVTVGVKNLNDALNDAENAMKVIPAEEVDLIE